MNVHIDKTTTVLPTTTATRSTNSRTTNAVVFTSARRTPVQPMTKHTSMTSSVSAELVDGISRITTYGKENLQNNTEHIYTISNALLVSNNFLIPVVIALAALILVLLLILALFMFLMYSNINQKGNDLKHSKQAEVPMHDYAVLEIEEKDSRITLISDSVV